MKKKIKILLIGVLIAFSGLFIWNVSACDMEFVPTCSVKLNGTFNGECVYTVTCITPEGEQSITFKCECGSDSPEQQM